MKFHIPSSSSCTDQPVDTVCPPSSSPPAVSKTCSVSSPPTSSFCGLHLARTLSCWVALLELSFPRVSQKPWGPFWGVCVCCNGAVGKGGRRIPASLIGGMEEEGKNAPLGHGWHVEHLFYFWHFSWGKKWVGGEGHESALRGSGKFHKQWLTSSSCGAECMFCIQELSSRIVAIFS